MKKLFVFLSLVLLVGCTCFGQYTISDQLVYVDSTCTAKIPNYLVEWENILTVKDNCEGLVVQQFPDPGTLLDFATPIMRVNIIATDAFGNSDSLNFNVIAVDTIPPTFVIDTSLMVFDMEKGGDLMKAMHYYVAQNIQQDLSILPDTTLAKWPQLAQWADVFDDYSMVTFYPKGGKGTYLGTFYSPGSYLCSCDSTQYYADIANGTVINLKFE